MTARLAAAFLVVGTLVASGAPLRAQISPGPLARAHAELEGARNCVRCHGPKKASMNASCQSCHKEIAWLVSRNRGYHVSTEAKAKPDCASCHPDHAGRDFALIAWPGGSPDRFDHRAAGWALEGGHLALKCAECHTAEFQSPEAARVAQRRSGSAGWTGLETSCVSCHAGDDVHRGAIRESCDACHDARDWTKASRFSHDSTDYPLTGRHAEVECNECHLSARLALQRDGQGQAVPIYSPVPAATCTACHDDPHAGRLTSRCTECHTTKSFTAIEGRAFNHSLTRYPLRGRHGRVSCASCHGPDLAKPRPAFDRCATCHSDPHNGSALLSGPPVDCDACHRVEAFSPSTFTVARHASARYPLEGRHLQVSCVKCHAPSASTDRAMAAGVARLRVPFARCADCHADSHAGQLSARADGGACESCHAVAGWSPSTYTIAQHGQLRVRLEGRHAEIPCRSCHGASRPGLPPPGPAKSLGHAATALKLDGAKCADCHTDPHLGRYAPGGALAVPGDCTECHSAVSFRPSLVTTALHDRFSLPLDGAHRAVACVACHNELKAQPATSTLTLSNRGVTRFPSATAVRTCATCHQNPHGAQFQGGKDRCESCHGSEAFVPASRFDHEKNATFSLRGAHLRVACAACHETRDVSGVRLTLYRPMSSKCESCHDRRRAS